MGDISTLQISKHTKVQINKLFQGLEKDKDTLGISEFFSEIPNQVSYEMKIQIIMMTCTFLIQSRDTAISDSEAVKLILADLQGIQNKYGGSP